MPHRRSALLRLAVLAGLALPALPSEAAVPTALLRTASLAAHQVVALGSERLVGVTWTSGSATVRYRWHSATGWTGWQTAEQDTGDSPVGLPGTAPLWRPRGADRVELSTSGTARHLTLDRVTDALVHRLVTPPAQAATGRAVLGEVQPRSAWGADESLRRSAPSYAPSVQAVVVHHTANANGYSAADVPALIRADYAYHVQGRGWADLGYNLLVDQFGRVWEGRYGGLGRATVGSHAQGFNTGTLGVAMLGDMTQTTASTAARRAMARVIGYAALTWHFDPAGSVVLTSKGSPKFASGRRVSLPRVFGHQQTGNTACPGSLQDDLPDLRRLAKVAMGPAPRVTSTSVSGDPVHAPTPLVVDATLSLPAAWTVEVLDADGAVRATAKGTGTAPHLSWDGLSGGLPALPGSYRWRLAADDGFHPVVTQQAAFTVGLPLVGL